MQKVRKILKLARQHPSIYGLEENKPGDNSAGFRDHVVVYSDLISLETLLEQCKVRFGEFLILQTGYDSFRKNFYIDVGPTISVRAIENADKFGVTIVMVDKQRLAVYGTLPALRKFAEELGYVGKIPMNGTMTTHYFTLPWHDGL